MAGSQAFEPVLHFNFLCHLVTVWLPDLCEMIITLMMNDLRIKWHAVDKALRLSVISAPDHAFAVGFLQKGWVAEERWIAVVFF